MPAIPLPNPPRTDGEIDPEIPRWTVVPHHYTQRHAREFISGTATDLANGRELALAIVDGGDDRLLGALGISNFDWGDLKGEIGYWIAPGARRRHGLREDLVMFSMLAEDLGA
jgi:RimJ/RimL family protein N-acetyltransferase